MQDTEDEIVCKLYHDLYRRMFNTAKEFLDDTELANDLVQETFLVICKRIEEVKDYENPHGWAMNVFKYCSLNYMRKHTRFKKYIILGADYDALVESGEEQYLTTDDNIDLDLLYSDISQTSEYKLIKLHYIEKHSIKEISQELGINENTCKKRLERARKKLKSFI